MLTLQFGHVKSSTTLSLVNMGVIRLNRTLEVVSLGIWFGRPKGFCFVEGVVDPHLVVHRHNISGNAMFDSACYTLSALVSLNEVELDIRQAEGLIAEKLHCTMTALQKGEDTMALEQRIGEMRKGLDLLYAQRSAIVRAAHKP